MTDGFGAISWWGFSPALDLQENNIHSKCVSLYFFFSDELCILLVGSGDSRHILKTVAQSYRHGDRRLHFYVLENNLELYARHILFLTIALEPPCRMGLQEKTELFLELFGNILVRQQSCEYVQKMANYFIKMVTDFDYLEKKLPLLDLSQLKFKERDFLEGIFKFWRNPNFQIFEVWKYWDARLRQYLKTRYDSRLNAFDWDYHMNLLERGGHVDIIHKSEYNHWREKGVAFEIREGAYDVPNKTLASGLIIKKDGENLAKRGYWGDILVSPFIALGVETEEVSMYKKYNQAYGKTAQDIAEYNVLAMFHELATREHYVLPKIEETTTSESEKGGPKLTEITEEDEESGSPQEKKTETEDSAMCESSKATPLDQEYEPLQVNGVKVTLLPLNCLPDMHKKSKYKKKFDLMYFSNSMVHQFAPEVGGLFKDKGILTMETAKFMLELKPEQANQFSDKITGMAKAAGCQPAKPCDGAKDDVAVFTFQRGTAS
ncbi:dynein axonemal assembly factor 3-like [Liolophura sinensis]|uniref:dynein axonemal assembly factor 3-like n=1 Tax=Liolophura sinensis TaxID=3198878 RepID=UPI0031588AD5